MDDVTMPTDAALDDLLEAAIVHFNDGHVVASLELFTEYFRHRSDNIVACYFYGESLRIVGRYNESEVEFLKVLTSDSKYSGRLIHTRLARLYEDIGKRELAEEHWRSACSVNDAKGWAWTMRGANLASCGRYVEAESCHRKALTFGDCVREEAFLNLGYVLSEQAKYVDAELAFKHALEVSPHYAEAVDGLRSLEDLI